MKTDLENLFQDLAHDADPNDQFDFGMEQSNFRIDIVTLTADDIAELKAIGEDGYQTGERVAVKLSGDGLVSFWTVTPENEKAIRAAFEETWAESEVGPEEPDLVEIGAVDYTA